MGRSEKRPGSSPPYRNDPLGLFKWLVGIAVPAVPGTWMSTLKCRLASATLLGYWASARTVGHQRMAARTGSVHFNGHSTLCDRRHFAASHDTDEAPRSPEKNRTDPYENSSEVSKAATRSTAVPSSDSPTISGGTSISDSPCLPPA